MLSSLAGKTGPAFPDAVTLSLPTALLLLVRQAG